MPQPYYSLQKLLEMIPEPNRTSCQKILADIQSNSVLNKAPGASHNHQSWPGGYLDHVCEAMNYAVLLYRIDPRPLPFCLESALVVLFVHDLEKPWKFLYSTSADPQQKELLKSKDARAQFRLDKIREYGIVLTVEEENALTYVEGEGSDYSPSRRMSNELANFCHISDTYSARVRPNHPLMEDDSWRGAVRHVPVVLE